MHLLNKRYFSAIALFSIKIVANMHRHALTMTSNGDELFTRESSYCFQRVLAIAILCICPSVCHTGGSVKN